MRKFDIMVATAWLLSSVVAVRLPFHHDKRMGKRGAVAFHAARDAQSSSSSSSTSGPSSTWKSFAATGPTDIDLRTSRDLIYIATVTVSGTDYSVQLDTGSSDLWVHTTNGLSGVKDTGLAYNLTYGTGYAYGDIVTAPVQFAGFDLPAQAVVDAMDASNPVLNLGAVGILGLGFTGLSGIDSAVNGSGASYGRSLLYNIFAQDPSVPNFITFLLSRSNDPNAPVEGSFTISETDDQYAAVSNGVRIPTFPVEDPIRWCVLLDGFATNGKRYSVGTTVKGTGKSQAVVLLDSGTTYTYAPDTVVNAIYSKLNGSKFNNNLGQWVLPCDTEVQVSLYFAGQQFDLNPLDIVVPSTGNSKTCVGTLIPMSLPIAEGQFDWLIGVNVLRSFYSLYDFGDPVGHSQGVRPYVQLLQLRTAEQASADFHGIRGGAVPTAPANAMPTDAGSTGPPGGSSGGSGSGSGSGSGGNGGGGISSISASVRAGVSRLVDYLPAMVGILGINVAILIALLIGGVIWAVRRRKSKKRTPATLDLGGAYKQVSTMDDPTTPVARQRSRSPLPASPLPMQQAPAPQYDSASLPLRRPIMPAAAADFDARHSTAF